MKNSKSVVFKRQQALLKELREEKTIDVESVAKKLSVSPTTIRRDLVMFEKQNRHEGPHEGILQNAPHARLLTGRRFHHHPAARQESLPPP